MYSRYANFKDSFDLELTRFSFKLIFSTIFIFILYLFDFVVAFLFLLSLFLIFNVLYYFYSKETSKYYILDLLFDINNNYKKSFGKSIQIMFLSIIFAFSFNLFFLYFLDYDVEYALIISFLVFGLGSNLSSFILYFKAKQYHIFGTTLEYFLLSSFLNLILIYLLLNNFYFALFLALSVQLVLILPDIDHNFSTFFFTQVMLLLYILL